MMLTLAPLMMLVTLFVAFHGELREALPALRHSRGWRVLALALACLGAVELGFAAVRVTHALRVASTSFSSTLTGALPEGYPRSADPVAPFALVDQHGREVTAAALHGRPTVLTFVFAHCRTVCPALLQTLARAARELPDGAQVVVVTLDPWRDTPATLASTMAGWPLPEGSRLLSGEPDAVARWLDAMGVARERDLQTGDVSHVPLVMVLDEQGRIAYRFSNPPAEWIAEGVRRVRRGA
jgi:protein SCO1/2